MQKMKIIHSLTIISLTITLVSCTLHGARETTGPLFDFTGTTIVVREKIIVEKGEVFDGQGNLYDWKGKGDCSQTEGMPPMFVLGPDSTLKNVYIRNAPDGIHIKGSNVTIDNMVNVDVCEDAISISKSKHYLVGDNIKITNSRFYDCRDKAIQLTRGSNILIKNNEFHRCAKAIRIKEKASNIMFENNKIYDSKSAVKATGGTGIIKGNVFDGAHEALWAEQGAVLNDAGGNVFINVETPHKQTEGGKIRG